MILEPIKPQVLAVRVIPNVEAQLARKLALMPHHRSIGMITCTIDDSLYAALDEGTKAAEVDVVYAKSFYAGSAHASGPFSGEIIGIFAASDPEIVSSGLQATIRYLEKKAWFYSADYHCKLLFFPHVIPRVGRYLSKQADVPAGTPMAYLIAPPIEAVLGLDAALKVAKVEIKVFYAPPTETNFAGGLLVGEQPEVEAAAKAFEKTVLDLASNPSRIEPEPNVEKLSETFAKVRARKGEGQILPYRIFQSGMSIKEKPDDYTHLFDNQSLVHKSHPVIKFRGKLDLLQAYVLDATVVAAQEGHKDIVGELNEILEYLRSLMAAEVRGSPVPELNISGFSAEELHRISHNTIHYMNVGWVKPSATMGATLTKLNLLRAFCREVELTALDVFEGETHLTAENRQRLLHGLNRLSNAIYVLVCKLVGRMKK